MTRTSTRVAAVALARVAVTVPAPLPAGAWSSRRRPAPARPPRSRSKCCSRSRRLRPVGSGWTGRAARRRLRDRRRRHPRPRLGRRQVQTPDAADRLGARSAPIRSATPIAVDHERGQAIPPAIALLPAQTPSSGSTASGAGADGHRTRFPAGYTVLGMSVDSARDRLLVIAGPERGGLQVAGAGVGGAAVDSWRLAHRTIGSEYPQPLRVPQVCGQVVSSSVRGDGCPVGGQGAVLAVPGHAVHAAHQPMPRSSSQSHVAAAGGVALVGTHPPRGRRLLRGRHRRRARAAPPQGQPPPRRRSRCSTAPTATTPATSDSTALSAPPAVGVDPVRGVGYLRQCSRARRRRGGDAGHPGRRL